MRLIPGRRGCLRETFRSSEGGFSVDGEGSWWQGERERGACVGFLRDYIYLFVLPLGMRLCGFWTLMAHRVVLYTPLLLHRSFDFPFLATLCLVRLRRALYYKLVGPDNVVVTSQIFRITSHSGCFPARKTGKMEVVISARTVGHMETRHRTIMKVYTNVIGWSQHQASRLYRGRNRHISILSCPSAKRTSISIRYDLE